MFKLQALREVIITAVPSIMNLEFGCEIKRSKQDKFKHFVLKSYLSKDQMVVEFWTEGKSLVETTMGIEHWEIFGRKIGVADVVYAYEKINTTHGHDDFKRNRVLILDYFNLLDDDLSHQSEETINFLHDLLV